MKKLLTLGASLMLLGCAGKYPAFPDIKKHYFVDMQCTGNPCQVAKVTCVEFEIISTNPYKIANPKEVALIQCQGVGGYTIKDMQLLLNWVDDAQDFFSDYRCTRK